ncbi:hypothetical protein LHJ74_28270 [Streptomyces sp. N2-109]|uniref:Uncharacterized protein n=1 Tax=Streptomyces gossypii TaxID=2883101 RepID=A0ABT2K2P6_9ACTN|nr:hypothetical protein [Streptomyces gossypii]MCT2593754.1 hypothetical protein [Streptomyces gossypii]
MLVPVAPSVYRSPDGKDIRWAGFFTGHRVLDEGRVAGTAQQLLGMDCASVAEHAKRELSPYYADSAGKFPALLLHSATPTLRSLDGDLASLVADQVPHDVATYVEARSVFLGAAADLAVGRTAPWAEAVGHWRIPAVDVGDVEHYYLSHALLTLAIDHERGADTPLGRIIGWLRDRPEAVIRLYALDLEMQIFLLWLRRKTGRHRLVTDANSPAVATRWNRKAHLHPTVEAARTLAEEGLSADALLIAEQLLSEAHQRLGLRIPVLPGYTVPRAGVSREAFVAGVLDAAELLRTRYGLRAAALKPSEAGDGARIVGDLDLTDTARLAAEARAAHPMGDDCLLEAWVDFLPAELDGARLPVVPSGQFRYGLVADGLTLQTLDGFSWRGNSSLDESGWVTLGLPGEAYRTIREALHAIRAAFVGPESLRDGSHQGLATGGVDFAVGSVGGRFGDRLLVGAMDFNLSSHGSEYLRTFQDLARREGVSDRYAATRVFRPAATHTLARMEATAAALAPPGSMMRAVACVPERWGMVAATGPDPGTAAHRTEQLLATLLEAHHPR